MALEDEPADATVADEAQELLELGDDLKAEGDRIRELAKFRAGSWDRLSTQLVTVSVFTPLVGFLYGWVPVMLVTRIDVLFAVVACLIVAFLFHLAGDDALKRGYPQ